MHLGSKERSYSRKLVCFEWFGTATCNFFSFPNFTFASSRQNFTLANELEKLFAVTTTREPYSKQESL